MTLNELQEQASKLPSEERLQLIEALMRSLQPQSSPTSKPKGVAASLIGIARIDNPTSTDEDVSVMLDERLVQKYL
ncbi:MAG: addiction module protein [Cyanobacteria bacterium J06634_5]